MMGDDTYEQISLRNVAPVVQVGIEDGNKGYGPMEKVWKQEDYLKFRQITVMNQ